MLIELRVFRRSTGVGVRRRSAWKGNGLGHIGLVAVGRT